MSYVEDDRAETCTNEMLNSGVAAKVQPVGEIIDGPKREGIHTAVSACPIYSLGMHI